MLLLDAEICFDKLEDNSYARHYDIDTTKIVAIPINFGNDLLFTCVFTFDKSIITALRGKKYIVGMEMITINDEAFEAIRNLIVKNAPFKIQEGINTIGSGKILDYIYESEE